MVPLIGLLDCSTGGLIDLSAILGLTVIIINVTLTG
jgi:hypothetical protein|tara:strand:- start:157 stop:264 length:108 start_codon:yes stop_codon:yes gene_type:complete